MPVGEIIGHLVIGVVRFVGDILVDVVVEVLIKGPGYLICRRFPPTVDPDGARVIVVGLLVWAAAGAVGYFIYRWIVA